MGPPDRKYAFDLSVSAPSEETLCSLMRNAIWSVSFNGDWTQLKVLSVSEDSRSFTFEYAPGQHRLGVLGDLVTRDHGKVVEISHQGIKFVELYGDSTHGWKEVERSVPAGR
jgi:hypothetical protein